MQDSLVEFLKQTEGIPKVLVGSYNLQLQGIEIVAQDIDFLTDVAGIQKIAELFAADINREQGFDACEFSLGGQTINCVSCEGNRLRRCDFMARVQAVRLQDVDVPCIPLDSELAFYRASGRGKDLAKVRLIEAALEKS